MSDSIENKLRNISKSVKGPIPTLLKKPESVNEDLGVGGGGDVPGAPCGVRLTNPWQAFIYDALIYSIYDRSPGLPVVGGNEGLGQVTTRDLVSPLWERNNPEFNPADPNTWDSVFGPGREAERLVRFFNTGLTDADIRRMVEELKQLYILRCGFLVQEGGACCSPDGEFGGFRCTEGGTPAECVGGIFHAGKTCAELGGDNCALASNFKMAEDTIKTQKQVMDMVMSMIKVK
jgi:hypothetical protein